MIVLTKPTGQIGRLIPASLLGSSESIRVIVRDPARLDPQIQERVEVVQGSHGDIDVVTQAFAGTDCVFWLMPPNPQAESVESYYLDFTRPACEANVSQRVKQVVGVSTLGQGYAKNAGLLSAVLAMDAQIGSTGASYRALCMPFFMENLLHQVDAVRS